MQTDLSSEFQGTADGDAAQAILRKCVHCGFCTATCPTYQLLGDELDGPRGRIYLIKQVLEGEPPTRVTQLHLDRCLTCRNCETTCPSGVQYGALIDIGRRVVDAKVPRPALERAQRWALREGMTSTFFAPALKLGRAARPLLPKSLAGKIPRRSTPLGAREPRAPVAGKMLLLRGCVQRALMPGIEQSTVNVLHAAGIETVFAQGAGCCGAVRAHLSDRAGALADMRRNIDAWWPFVEQGGIDAIVMNASGCGITVKEYAHHLHGDIQYAERAKAISALTVDLGELLPRLVPRIAPLLRPASREPRARLAYHPPCTLQHAQKLHGGIEAGLRELGFSVDLAASESHLCCGSAGTYSVTQPDIANALRDRKLAQLSPHRPDAIVSANVGCIQHLQGGTGIPVRHWIELVNEAMA
jgi:glycolate oxidase iron-sulfur subunit